MKPKHKLILWLILIFALTSIPNARIAKEEIIDFILRKSIHITEYFILFIFSYFTFGKNNLKATVFAIMFAISDEIHQHFVPGRGPAFKDVLVDTFGIILGNIYIWNFWQKTPTKIKKLLNQ
ncbi:hypothetical protein COV24_01895 [candidate division WWE3 bacterium CG10_big_fil_rev_8_21_14_0_10_32_10]|uniref:VanZ-like domain-containing protein n=1 Tax=candidate division WWE3 bacterium CG10_big_fil_rev_8_21_14_0_10_32_10 TaxID=1975090 RepID=A0A2H0RBZ5_UNCKA|nr:MAG: hypothetical protein COV24_01895 [candidate division WWE3 bacterium CG10_big_fil_rev_8_21_14_0_10_32_10]